jgi:anti-anti-sigma factor
MFGPNGGLDPHIQVEEVLGCAYAALEEGYAGLRILGDVSELAAQPALSDLLLEYEAAVDTVPTTTRTTAMCAVDRRRAPDTWRPLSALHRLQHAPDWEPSFTIHLEGQSLRLGGEVDLACADELQRLLPRLATTTQGDLSLDLQDLEFIDVAGTRVIAMFRHAMTAQGRVLHLQNLNGVAHRTFPAFRLEEHYR